MEKEEDVMERNGVKWGSKKNHSQVDRAKSKSGTKPSPRVASLTLLVLYFVLFDPCPVFDPERYGHYFATRVDHLCLSKL